VPDGQDRFETDFEITNLSAQTRQVTAHLIEQSTSGLPLPSSAASADKWVQVVPTSATLDPNQRERFHVIVDAPPGREPGERRVGVDFQLEVPPGAAQLKFVPSVVAPVLIPGHGQVVRSLALGQIAGPTVADWAPVSFSVTATNRGNVHRDLQGQDSGLVVSTSSGDHFAVSSDTLPPGTSVLVTGVWAQPPPLCWCEIAVSTDDGNGRLIVSRTHVLVLPIRVFLGVAVIVGGLGLILGAFRQRRARRRTAELEAARQEGMRIARQQAPKP
jgi:hypothetical protein